jgi:hypothetical protein
MTNNYYENVYKKEALANPRFFSKTGDGEDKKLLGIVLVK